MPVKNFNTTIAKNFHDMLNVRDGVFLDNELSQNKAVPVIEVDKRIANVVKRATATNATNAVIYTTPSDKDFYLTSASVAFVKDGSNTSTATYIQIYFGGATTQILHIPHLASSAGTGALSCSFPAPIKVDRSQAITVNTVVGDANITVIGCIQGFLSDTLQY